MARATTMPPDPGQPRKVEAAAASEPTSLFGGRLRLLQPARGYRVNVDTLLLGAFAAKCRPRGFSRIVDLGAGVGALGLSVAHLVRVGRLDLMEANAALAALARANLAASGLRGAVLQTRIGDDDDARAAFRASSDGVVCNPPFFPAHAAQAPSDGVTHESRLGDVEPFLAAAAYYLGKRGSAYFVYPSSALPELFGASARARLVPKRLRLVHAFPDAPARIALVELKRARPGGLAIEPPLIEWSGPGERTREVAALLESGDVGSVDRPRASR